MIYDPSREKWVVFSPFGGMAVFDSEAAARRCVAWLIALNVVGAAAMLAAPFWFLL